MSSQYQISGSTAASIAASIEQAVAEGALAPGELLPPVRALAAALGVSPGTVAAAYRLAGQRGLTVADRRRGTRVQPRRHESALTTLPAAGRTGAASRERTPVPEGIEDLASGDPDPALLPDLRDLLARLDHRPARYGAPRLAPELGAAARAALAADGVDATHLTCTFGGLDGIWRVLSTSCRPGDRVAVEDPGWPSLLDGLTRAGYRLVPVALDERGMLPDRLAAAVGGGVRAVVMTSRAQNPTGAALDSERAGELAAVLASAPGVLVVEDDHGHQIAGPEVGLFPVMAGGSGPGQWALVRSAAKACGPDLRVAVVAGDAATVRRVDESVAATAGFVSHLLQQAVAALWSEAALLAAAGEAGRIYASRREALAAALAREGIALGARSGFHLFVPVADEATAVASLLRSGYGVAPGAPFRLASPPAVRVSAARLEPEAAPALAHAVAAAARAGAGVSY